MRLRLKAATSSAILSIVLISAGQLSAGSAAKSGLHRHWSIDLTNYWPFKEHQGQSFPFTDAYLAADNSFVAVAVEAGDPDNGPWASSLLVFDADSGKLHQECGPWDGRMITDFSATANGNFLLTWEPFPGAKNAAAKLSLLSTSCTERQNVELPPRIGWNGPLSPSRRTLLTVDTRAGSTNFTVRDADTFAIQREWQEPESGEMQVESVSDVGVLALKHKAPSDVFGPAEIFYRAFGTAAWQNLTDTLASTNRDVFATFLTNDTFLEAAEVGKSDICYPAEEKIELRQVTGQLISSRTLAKSAHAVDFPLIGDLALSIDGRYFGSVLRSTNVGWFWCNFDLRLEHYYFYLWSTSSLKPAAVISLGDELFFPPLPLAVAPNGTWFAIQKGNTLSVRPLNPPR